jgi:hypothetical protein
MIHVVSESLYQRCGRFVAVISGSGSLSFIGSPEGEKFSVLGFQFLDTIKQPAISNQRSANPQSAIRNPQSAILQRPHFSFPRSTSK